MKKRLTRQEVEERVLNLSLEGCGTQLIAKPNIQAKPEAPGISQLETKIKELEHKKELLKEAMVFFGNSSLLKD